MSQFKGTVISVQQNVQVAKRAGGTYLGYELVYKGEDGKIQTLAKTMHSLKYTPSVAKALNELQQGDVFICVQQKNEAGFLDVISITKGDEPVPVERAEGKTAQPDTSDGPATTVSPARRGNSYAPGAKTGNTYETPEERAIRRQADAVRQTLIIRQSSFDQARQFLAITADSDGTLKEVFETAEKIEAWVMRGYNDIPH